MVNRPSDPSGATDRVTAPGEASAVDVVSSYRQTKNIDVTAGVRYRSDDRVEPLTDSRRDSQAVYIGTAFRFCRARRRAAFSSNASIAAQPVAILLARLSARARGDRKSVV